MYIHDPNFLLNNGADLYQLRRVLLLGLSLRTSNRMLAHTQASSLIISLCQVFRFQTGTIAFNHMQQAKCDKEGGHCPNNHQSDLQHACDFGVYSTNGECPLLVNDSR